MDATGYDPIANSPTAALRAPPMEPPTSAGEIGRYVSQFAPPLTQPIPGAFINSSGEVDTLAGRPYNTQPRVSPSFAPEAVQRGVETGRLPPALAARWDDAVARGDAYLLSRIEREISASMGYQ